MTTKCKTHCIVCVFWHLLNVISFTVCSVSSVWYLLDPHKPFIQTSITQKAPFSTCLFSYQPQPGCADHLDSVSRPVIRATYKACPSCLSQIDHTSLFH